MLNEDSVLVCSRWGSRFSISNRLSGVTDVAGLQTPLPVARVREPAS